MRNVLLLIALSCCIMLIRCTHSINESSEIELSSVPDPFHGAMTVKKDGKAYQFYIFANPNGYQEGELVLQGAATSWDRVLMLTFQLTPQGRVVINKGMTGYWDMGFCRPTKRYLLVKDYPNYVGIEGYDTGTSEVSGEFSIKVKNEQPPYDAIEFKDGRFKARIDEYKFTYCFEG